MVFLFQRSSVILVFSILSVMPAYGQFTSRVDSDGCCAVLDAMNDPFADSVCTAIDALPINAITTLQIKHAKCMTVPKDGYPGPGPGFVNGCAWFSSNSERCRSDEHPPVAVEEGCCISNEYPWVNPVCKAVDDLAVPPSTWAMKQNQCLNKGGQCLWLPSNDQRCAKPSSDPVIKSSSDVQRAPAKMLKRKLRR